MTTITKDGTINLRAAARHLQYLEPENTQQQEFVFQTFDDDKKRVKRTGDRRARMYTGTFDKHRAALIADSKMGNGVFVTICHMRPGTRRAKENADGVRKHFVEIDGNVALDEILKWSHKPDYIIESSPNHYHVYWDVDIDVTNDIDGFEARQKQLATHFGGGMESVDKARVLRLAGFPHQKGKPFIVRVVHEDKNAPSYSVDDFKLLLGEAIPALANAGDNRTPAIEESEETIKAAIDCAKSQPIAISDEVNPATGKKGNNTAYQVACAVRDRGVNADTCLKILMDHWSPRCKPSWDGYEDELEQIVKHAYAYAQEPQGQKMAQTIESTREDMETFKAGDAEYGGGILAEFLAKDRARDAERRAAKLGLSVSTSLVPASSGALVKVERFTTPYIRGTSQTRHKRAWLYDKHYIRKYVTADVAPGAGAKTSHELVEAIAMVTGVDLLGVGDDRMPENPLRVAYWNGEDPREEIQLRLDAILQYYSEPEFEGTPMPLDAAALELVKQNLFVDIGRELPIKIATEKDGNFVLAVPLVKEMTQAMIEGKFDVLMIDPYVSSHSISENDNVRLAAIIEQAWAKVAEDSNSNVNIAHHARKGDDEHVRAVDARGASSFVAACRDVRVYNKMTFEQAQLWEISEPDRWRYFRVASDKPNMSARGGASPWRKLLSVTLACVDGTEDVGVVGSYEPPKQTDEQKAESARKLESDVLKYIDDPENRLAIEKGGTCNLKGLAAKLHVTKTQIVSVIDALRDAKVIGYREAHGKTKAGFYRR